MTISVTVEQSRVAAFLCKLRAFKKKLALKGLSLTFSQEDEINVPVKSPSGKLLLIPAIPFTIEAPVLQNKEWTVIAKVSWNAGAPPVVYGLTNDAVPESLLEENVCMHCHREVPRKTVYILKHQDGYCQRVGSSCVDEYAGISASSIAQHYRLMDTLNRIVALGRENDINWAETYDVEAAIAAALSLIQTNGFLSSKQASLQNKVSSKAMVEEALRNHEQLQHAQTQEVWDWLKEQFPPVCGDVPVFHGNVVRAVNAHLCTARSLGFLVWAVSLWFEKNAPVSQWVGTIGERQGAEVTVLSVSEREGRWGTCFIQKMETEKGDLLVWSTHTPPFQVGQKLKISFKVTEHKEFRGRKETYIQRVKQA